MRLRAAALSALPVLTSLALGLGLAAVPTATATPAPERSSLARPAPKEEAPGLRALSAKRWLLDTHGRTLVLHGLNMVYKLPPYAPDAIGFGKDDAEFLAANGFTTVRLGLIWKAVEPQPGQYDDAYLARIRRTANVLADAGIWTMLDFHQDLYNERFEGEGAPDWAVQDDGLPAEPKNGFPYNYFAMPALNRAFDHFWLNDEGPGGVGLQDRYAAAWAHVASYVEDTPRILGFDLFNEPWPGTTWKQCANPAGCPAFDMLLQEFSERVIRAIREVDQRTTIFYEPHVLFNNGSQTTMDPEGSRLGFSFHDYCLTAEADAEGQGEAACDTFDDLVWSNMESHMKVTGHTPLLTEFGATTDQATLTSMVDRAAEHRVGWQYWAYCGCGDPTTTGPGATQALVFDPAKPPVGDNIDQAKLAAISVPHPVTVAGTPIRYDYARADKVLTATWSTKKAGAPGRFGGGSVTTLAMPPAAYPHGYQARVTGGRIVSAPDAPTLLVEQAPGADRVRVVVQPG